MITDSDQSLVALNELQLANRDAAQGFATAAEHVTEPELIELFGDLARQRETFRAELELRIRTLRGDPARLPNPAAALHRAWIDLKAAIATRSDHAMLEECERGEDMAVKAYMTVLRMPDLDVPTRQLIQAQYEQVQAAHDRVRQLRDSAPYAHR